MDAGFDAIKVYASIEAGLAGDDVGDGENGFRQGCTDALGELFITGDGDDGFDGGVADGFDGFASTRGEAAVDLVAIAQFEESTNIALTAADAAIDIHGDIALAGVLLQAVRGEQEELVGGDPYVAEARDPVVQAYELFSHGNPLGNE